MDLKEMMGYKNFVVVGNTIADGKYAKKIKDNLIYHSYNVESVHKELKSIDDVSFDIDIIDLCINPTLGLEYLKNTTKKYKGVLIQPGAESDEIREYLSSNNIPYLEGCALIGMRMYKGKLIEE